MKKVFAISLVLVLAAGMSAMAADWVAYISASGVPAVKPLIIGALTGGSAGTTDYNAALDIAEPGEGAPVSGQYVDVTSQGMYVDFRAPITNKTETWVIDFTKQGGYAGSVGFYMAFSNVGDPVDGFLPGGNYVFTFTGAGISRTITAAEAATTAKVVEFAGVTGPVTITAGPVPEPGSMLALGSGLVGLVGFAIRRRK